MSSGTDSPRRRKGRRLGRGLSSLIQVETPVSVEAPEQPSNTKQIPSDTPAHSQLAPDDRGGDDADGPLTARAGAGSGGASAAMADEPGLARDASAGSLGGSDALREIPVDRIEPSPFQPRRAMDEVALGRLADSIRRSGVIQPIIVRQLSGAGSSSGGAQRFELIAGERRWRAARRAGLGTIPALVRAMDDEQAAELALVENVQREDLNAIERAWALRQLVERFGLTHSQIGARVGLDRSSVANLIRLTDLEEEVQALLAGGALTTGHGKALRAAPAGELRIRLAQVAAAERWTVRRLEQSAKQLAADPIAKAPTKPEQSPERAAALVDLEKQLGEHLGTRVTIRADRGGTKGRLSIAFYDLDHFDGLMAKMGFSIKS